MFLLIITARWRSWPERDHTANPGPRKAARPAESRPCPPATTTSVTRAGRPSGRRRYQRRPTRWGPRTIRGLFHVEQRQPGFASSATRRVPRGTSATAGPGARSPQRPRTSPPADPAVASARALLGASRYLVTAGSPRGSVIRPVRSRSPRPHSGPTILLPIWSTRRAAAGLRLQRRQPRIRSLLASCGKQIADCHGSPADAR